ncbi:MAG: hypothetical protein ACRYHQ_07625 [Janthinobacterium lividum]
MLDATPFRLHGHDYRVRPIPQDDSLRIWEALHAVSPHLLVMVPAESDAAMEPFVDAVSVALWRIPASARPAVVSACFASVERRHALRWRPIWDRATMRLLYDDITLNLFSQLALRVLCLVVVDRANQVRVRQRADAT